MSIQYIKQELTLGASELDKVREGFVHMQDDFTLTKQSLGEVLLHTEIAYPLLLAEARAEYEKATAALTHVAKVYSTKVKPNLAASGIQNIDGTNAQAASKAIQDIKPKLDRVTEKLMADFFGKDIFSDPDDKVKAFNDKVTVVRQAIDANLLEESGVIPQMHSAIIVAYNGVIAYRDGIDQ